MIESADPEVQTFIEDVCATDGELYEVLEALRDLVFDIYPAVDERMMYGGIMFSLEDDFGAVFVHTEHVTFEFTDGVQLPDPNGLLEGTGERRRHLKFETLADIEANDTTFYVERAV
ncbi:hypothetical protein C482_19174 [Natrialba chahannaoensis JCM 10990]|uniref:YdhG-like domain-containing protein n=1 Tax=Natrialba chahannaoensis JCM 10990 TaxID=1227492 RepID=M0A5F4_9EURY|nr:DUF1801 domain-containing protein [Natrialba chahannaoensis]ELY93551.1 hypothetical protein C482_19174 [Natrialba chahannaoensis JCM 10990]